MEKTTETQSISKYFYLKYRGFVLGILIGVLIMFKCTGSHDPNIQKVPQQLYDSLEAEYGVLKKTTENHLKNIAVLEKRVQYLDSVKQKVVTQYQKAAIDNRGTIAANPCDTLIILQAYDNTVSKCDSAIYSCQLETIAADSTIAEQKIVITDQTTMLQNRDQKLGLQEIDLKLANSEVKRQKRGKVAAIIVGIITTVGATVGTIFLMK